MKQIEMTAHFDFALTFPQAWLECLQKIKKDGFSAVSANIYWGLHESSPGIRDFSKSSKLKVEKFLQLAASVGLSVDLVFGFMPSRFTFPEWVKSIKGNGALVPALVWDGISGPYFLNEVPSLEHDEISTSFLSFFEEALTFLPLYKQPEGALRNVFFDAGIYHFNQSITDDSNFSRWLSEEYGKVELLNEKYQTAFNSFSNAGSKTGFRVLLDKRPWLAAFDYKSARNAYLNSFNDRVKKLSKDISIQIKKSDREVTISKWSVSFDSVFVEGDVELFPFSPEALVLPQSVMGYRFLQSIRESLSSWTFSPLPLWKTDSAHRLMNSVILNGKYLSGAGLEWIKESFKEGAQLLFPFGTPQFDEEMKLSRLLELSDKETVQIASDRKLQIYKSGQGRFIIPEPLCSFSPAFKSELENIISSLEENRGQT